MDTAGVERRPRRLLRRPRRDRDRPGGPLARAAPGREASRASGGCARSSSTRTTTATGASPPSSTSRRATRPAPPSSPSPASSASAADAPAARPCRRGIEADEATSGVSRSAAASIARWSCAPRSSTRWTASACARLEDRGATARACSCSPGRAGVETERATVLAGVGATALTYRLVRLCPASRPASGSFRSRAFDWAVDRLASQCDRVVLVGASKTAEAFLLYAADDPRVDAVVAAGAEPRGVGQRRHRVPTGTYGRSTRRGRGRGGPCPSCPTTTTSSRSATRPPSSPSTARACATHEDRGGGRDHPGRALLRRRAARRGRRRPGLALGGLRAGGSRPAGAAYDLPTTLVTHPDAGHRVILPGRPSPPVGAPDGARRHRGADRALGAARVARDPARAGRTRAV